MIADEGAAEAMVFFFALMVLPALMVAAMVAVVVVVVRVVLDWRRYRAGRR